MTKFVDVVMMVLLAEAVLGALFALGAFDEKPPGPGYVVSTTFSVEPDPDPVSVFDTRTAVESVLMAGCKVGLALLCVLPFLTGLFAIPLPFAAAIQVFVYWLYSKAIAEIRMENHRKALAGGTVARG